MQPALPGIAAAQVEQLKSGKEGWWWQGAVAWVLPLKVAGLEYPKGKFK